MHEKQKIMSKTSKGFTLVEILMVVALISILVAIVLVSLASSREKARVNGFKSQSSAIQTKAAIECSGLAINTSSALIAAIGTLPPNISVVQNGATNCGMGANTFNLRVTSSVVNNCVGTVTGTGIAFSGSAAGCQ